MNTHHNILVQKLTEHSQALALPLGRMVGSSGHDVTRDYLLHQMKQTRLLPFRGKSFELTYELPHPNTRKLQKFTNLVGVIPGKDRKLPPILVGAHYDSVIAAPCVDAKGNFTSVRERIIDAIPAAVSLEPPAEGIRLDINDYAETTAIRKAYLNRDYAECLGLLDSRINSHPSLRRNPLCMLLKALLLQHLERSDEIEKVLQGVSGMPFGNPSPASEFSSGLSMRLDFLEALGRHSEAESFVTSAIESAIAGLNGSSEDSMDAVDLYNHRARVRILKGDYAGALADERAAVALSPTKYSEELQISDAEARQLHLNTIVMQWELLEQEFPAYADYLEANGWPEPKPDRRNLKAED